MNTQILLFHALADPARLRIVEAMKSGECAVGDIVERMDIHQSGVSRHLRILAEAGIVQMRPDGRSASTPCARKLSTNLRHGWRDIAATGKRGSIDLALPSNENGRLQRPTLGTNRDDHCTHYCESSVFDPAHLCRLDR